MLKQDQFSHKKAQKAQNIFLKKLLCFLCLFVANPALRLWCEARRGVRRTSWAFVPGPASVSRSAPSHQESLCSRRVFRERGSGPTETARWSERPVRMRLRRVSSHHCARINVRGESN